MKVNQWQLGIYAHIGFDAESGLTRTVIIRATNYNDATQSDDLLHTNEPVVFADAGYQGAIKRPEAAGVDWHVAVFPEKRRKLNKNLPWSGFLDKAEQLKASVREKVKHPSRVVKCRYGFTTVREKEVTKNTVQLVKLFALTNVWMARRYLLGLR
jgi:IS5 family transposase